MTGAIRYEILPDIKLVVVCVVGDNKPEAAKSFLNQITEDPSFDPDFDNITDFSFAKMNFDQSDLLDFAEYFKSKQTYNGRRREAYIVQSASEMATLSIFSIYARYSPVEFNVVSSTREAMEFIGVRLENSQAVEQTLSALRNL